MKRKVYMFLVMLVTLAALSGCWSRRELNELAITLAVGVDKSEDQYKVSAQIVNPGEVATQKGGGGNAPVVTYTSTGDSIYEAIRKMTTKSPRKIYAAHLRLFVIGEELAAEEGIGKVIDLFSRDQELRTDYFIIIAKGTTAEQVLKILSIPLEKIPANKIFTSLQTSEQAWAVTSQVTLDELIDDLMSEGHNPLITGLEIIGDPNKGETLENMKVPSPPAVLAFDGMAGFDKDKLVGWLNEEESKGANYIKDKVKSTIENIPCSDDGLIGIELIRSNTEITVSIKNDTPKVSVTVSAEANIADVECPDVDLTDVNAIYEIEKKTEDVIKSHIDAAVKKAQEELNTDILGFGEVIHREKPGYWQKHKENWVEEFENLPVDVKVDIKLRRIGTVGNSFLKTLKE